MAGNRDGMQKINLYVLYLIFIIVTTSCSGRNDKVLVVERFLKYQEGYNVDSISNLVSENVILSFDGKDFENALELIKNDFEKYLILECKFSDVRKITDKDFIQVSFDEYNWMYDCAGLPKARRVDRYRVNDEGKIDRIERFIRNHDHVDSVLINYQNKYYDWLEDSNRIDQVLTSNSGFNPDNFYRYLKIYCSS